MTNKDKIILRELAKKQMEIAKSPQMEKLYKEWIAHNGCRGERPMITVEIGTFAQDVINPLMECETQEARNIEYTMRSEMAGHTLFSDDTPITDYFKIWQHSWINPFNLEVKAEYSENSIGHHFYEYIKDFEKDRHLLQKSSIGANKDGHIEHMDYLNGIFGDILPVKPSSGGLYAVGTQAIVHVMSMETMLFAMCDYPDEFKAVMDGLANDYNEYFRLLEQNDMLTPSTGADGIGQGTYALNDELPSKTSGLKTTDCWGYIDAQEMVSVSPQMFEELIFPAYKKITDNYGLLSYGCCEPVHPFWENCYSKMENLRKISISKWCDEEYMGEQLKGKKIIFHRKPDPNFLGVGSALDEEGLRAHIIKTVKAAKGCHLEFSTRDVYQINNTYEKVRRYVEIIREETTK